MIPDDLMQINKLRKYLLKSQKYDKNARPVKVHTTVVNVGFVMFIRRIIDLDLETRKMRIYTDVGMVIISVVLTSSNQ